MRKIVGALLVVALLVCATATAAGAVSRARQRRTGPTRVLLVGDSYTEFYEQMVGPKLGTGYEVTQAGFGGTGLLDPGICNGNLAKNLVAAYDPDVVVIEYVGNYGIPGGDGCKPGVVRGSKTFFAEWKKAARVNRKEYVARKARVVWVLDPEPALAPYDVTTAPINAIYRGIAGRRDGLVDGWSAFGGASFNASLHLPDLLHPNPAGSDILAGLIATAVR